MPVAMLLAALALVPQPTEVVEREGFCDKTESVVFTTDSAIPAEGYKLKITADGITVASSDAAGAFYAKVTLGQLGGIPSIRAWRSPMFRATAGEASTLTTAVISSARSRC